MLGIEAAAVALKFAVVFPPVTVTDAGTVNRALLLPSVTVDPPAGAVCVSVAVQVLTALGFRLPGLHVIDEMAGTVTTPLVPAVTVSPLPFASTPTGLFTVIAVVPAIDANVSCTFATTPAAIVLVFDPVRMQVSDPDAGVQ